MALRVKLLGNGRMQLTESLVHEYGVVPSGFVTDGFTLPWFVRWFHHPFGQGVEAAIVHDYELKRGNKNAHRWFKSLLRKRGVGKVKAGIMYFCVYTYQRVFNPRLI